MTDVASAVPALPKKERPHLGRSVLQGKVRFSSVSQIVIFDPRQEGGCNRRYAFIYIFGKKEMKGDAQRAGNKHAESLEQYLTTSVDTLTRELRAAKHFFPRPGPDLEVEQPLGDMVTAVARRDALLRGQGDPVVLVAEIRRAAGLVAAGVPLDGAADYRHRRGEYLDEEGKLRREPAGVIACEIADLKTTSRVLDHMTRPTKQNPRGHLEKGRAKTVEQMLWHPQNLGYGVHAAERYPEITHIRSSLVYAQTRHGLFGLKRTGLLTVGEIRHRWATTVEPLMREMIDIAANARRPEDVPVNLGSCTQFGKPCPHSDYCDRPNQTIVDLLSPKGASMTAGLFSPIATGVPPLLTSPSLPVTAPPPLVAPSVQAGLFSPTTPTLPVQATAGPPPLLGADRDAAIAAATAKLLAEDAAPPVPIIYGTCSSCGVTLTPANAYLDGANYVHFNCSGVPAIPPLPGIGAVNPPDAPAPDWRESASPVPPSAMADITDPKILKQVQAHAAAVEQQKRETEAGKPQTEKKVGGRCPGGGQRVVLTPDEATGKVSKRLCHLCGKKLKLSPSADKTEATLPPHNVLKPEAGAPTIPPLPASAQVPQVPPLPTTPPPLPPGAARVAPPLPPEAYLGVQTQVVPPIPPLAQRVRLPALPDVAVESPGAAIIGLGTAVYIFLDPLSPPPPGVYRIGAGGAVTRVDSVPQ